MKKLVIAVLLAGQIAAAAQPAHAAEIVGSDPPRSYRTGAFVGARLHVPLSGERRAPQARLAAAPMLHSVQPNGETRSRFGRGLEVGLDGDEVRLALAGRTIGGEAPNGRRRNISTIGWIGIGVGVIAVSVFTLYALCGSGEICSTDDD